MTTATQREMRKSDLAVLAALVALAIAGILFRDAVGLIGFLVLLVAALIQLIRVLFFMGSRKKLKDLWEALRDAIWGL